jgi:ABC-type glutathione transport system ATPase component
MDIGQPEIDTSHGKPRLFMYCPENRIPREIFWSGFGFQVWCQMLTHLIQSSETSLFLIDEPDIYLHSELQRQLLSLLRNLGPDILIATHSTEIITEAEADEIVLVNKNKGKSRRIKNASQIEDIFNILGSNINPILTQLAKTRRVVFVEDKDFQIIGKLAQRLGSMGVGNRREFAVVPVEGFNPERIRNLKEGMEATLGTRVSAAIILDRDYRCPNECTFIEAECSKFSDFVSIHKRKEIENFLLVPSAIDRAISRRLGDRARRLGQEIPFHPAADAILTTFANLKKTYVISQILAEQRRFERVHSPGFQETVLAEETLTVFEESWSNEASRLEVIPGKDALSAINQHVQQLYSVNITPTAIIDAMHPTEIPEEAAQLVEMLNRFSTRSQA